MSLRIASLLSLTVAALALGCGQEEAAPAADAAAAPVTSAATDGAPAAVPAANPGAPDGSPFSVTHQVEGDGASPTAADRVTVHYAGRFADGTEFDSSTGKAPVTFPLNRVISCWTQGVAQMKVGGKATLVCPPEMAYGERGTHPLGGATLTFEVELLGIQSAAPAAPAAPQ